MTRASLQADLANAPKRTRRLTARVHQLERRLPDALGEQAWRESVLGAPVDVDRLQLQLTTLEQQVIDLRLQLEERDHDLDAARAANREPMPGSTAAANRTGMKGFELPDSLVRDVQADDDDGPARRAWLAELPLIVDDLARRWALHVGRPFQPGGAASWVAPARTAAGDRVVLKVGWLHDEAVHEADGLRAWDGQGVVRLLGSLSTGSTSALLLEACEPGTPLAQALPAHEQDVVIAGLLRRLWIPPSAGHPFRPLQAMCEQWASEFEEKYATARARGLEQLDPGLARAGIELLRQLPATAGHSVLLCTDLHHDNVLAAAREPWLVIDPKPIPATRPTTRCSTC